MVVECQLAYHALSQPDRLKIFLGADSLASTSTSGFRPIEWAVPYSYGATSGAISESAAPAGTNAAGSTTTHRNKRKRSFALLEDEYEGEDDAAAMYFSIPFRHRRRATLSQKEVGFLGPNVAEERAAMNDDHHLSSSGLGSSSPDVCASLVPLYLQREQLRLRIIDASASASVESNQSDSDWPRALQACCIDSGSARAARGLVRLHLAGCGARKSSTRARLEVARRRVSDYFSSLSRYRPLPDQGPLQQLEQDLLGQLLSTGQELESFRSSRARLGIESESGGVQKS